MKNPWLAAKISMLLFVPICGALGSAEAQSTGQPLGQAAVVLGPAPSWVVDLGAANTCVEDDVLLMADVNAPNPASEKGVLSAPGVPNLGFTVDTNFTGVGTFGFTVFTDPYNLPANTPLTLEVTTFFGPNFDGGISYISRITWDCTTGEVLSRANFRPLTPAPTLSVAALMLLAAALAGVGTVVLRRRSVT